MQTPLLYEINTRPWLRALEARHGGAITLDTVPEEELARWKRLGVTHLWLMGVWSSGARAREQALSHPDLRRAYAAALPDWTEADVGGSPYAIAEYRVPAALGGNAGLQKFRRRLREAGLRLVLDFVPNHVGLDHSWVRERPELLVRASSHTPGTILEPTARGGCWLAHGRDPYFPPWVDTVQLDYRTPATRGAMVNQLKSVAELCDGVRCDMAMLVLSEVFEKTWHDFAPSGPADRTEFWVEAITAVRETRPDFLFLAEAYWGLEARLRELGFDHAYDKTLYDRIISRDAQGLQRHLLAQSPAALAGCAHFLENHDEPRIAPLLSEAEHRAAALLVLGLPGLRLLHDGQLDGHQIKMPVQLLRPATEPGQATVRAMYEQILSVINSTAPGQEAEVIEPRPAWAGNSTNRNFVLVQRRSEAPEFDVVAINLAPHRSQCYAPLRPPISSPVDWTMRDLLGTEEYRRDTEQLRDLYLDLGPHGAQWFHFQQAN